MKNILKIIVSDIKRLSVNVVAVVVILGLTVIPCLYAWFNILSNWDPYGPDATKNLQVAVASSDQGIMIGTYELNVGDIIISNLKENTTIGWVFTDTAEEAIGGVHAGDYYAALVIDEKFSADMISFLGGSIENPVITYYENEKKNAIAPKITGKVKTTIEREVDHAFISTIAEALLKSGEYFATLDEEGNITGKGIEKLESLDSDLKGVIIILDSYIALSDSAEQVSKAGKAVTDTAKSVTKMAEEIANDAAANAATKEDVQNVKNKTDEAAGKINNKFDNLDGKIAEVNNKLTNYTVGKQKTGAEVYQIFNTVTNSVWNGENGLYSFWLKAQEIIKINDDLVKAMDDFNTTINDTDKHLKEFADAEATGAANIEELRVRCVTDTRKLLDQSSKIRGNYVSLISPLTQQIIDTSADSINEVKKLLKYNATSLDMVVKNLKDYSKIMDNSKGELVKSRNEAVEMEQQLSQLIADIKGLSKNEAYQTFMDLLRSDPDLLADFVSSPVVISEEYIYPVENNGSMTAPFYIVLSIWVGSLIMSTIIKTNVKDKSGFTNLKNWECFFGRYFVTFVIGQIQTLITVLGAFLFVGIQCKHPFLMWLACAWTSLVYSLLLYSFAYSFGNIGEALSVILMVIQVAGAGGTFPIEVLPKVFQILYKYMPFNYSMNAVRECIGGFYENTYDNCMWALLVYALIAIFIGVILYHPFKYLNNIIEESKEKSGILL